MKDFADRRGRISAHAHPTHTNRCLRRRYRFSGRQEPQQIRIVHPRRSTETVPAPNTWVDVQQLELPVTRISFEFNFHDACVLQRLDEANCCRWCCRVVDGLNEGAGAPKIHGNLSDPPRGKRCDWPSVFTQCRVGELRFASARNHLLNHQSTWVNQLLGLLVACAELLSVIYTPSFRCRESIEAAAISGF